MAIYDVYGGAGRLRATHTETTATFIATGLALRGRVARTATSLQRNLYGAAYRGRYAGGATSLVRNLYGGAYRRRHASGAYEDRETPYQRLLLKLLPHGFAWTRELDSQLALLLRAFAAEFARVEARGRALVEEADPRTTSELLADWERNAGLPSACVTPTTIAGRRAALTARITDRGGQTLATYEELATALGYAVTIEEYQPFTCVSECLNPLTQGDWVFVVSFVTASGSNDEVLECVLGNRIPLHMKALFRFE